jgi:hypothetical protein
MPAVLSYGPKLGFINNATIGEAYYDQLRPFLRAFDSLVQGTVLNTSVTDPPVSPANGDAYLLIGGGLTGAWTGQDNKIAVWSTQITDTGNNTLAPGWDFYTPNPGWLVYAQDLTEFVFFDGTVWGPLISVPNPVILQTTVTISSAQLLAMTGSGVGEVTLVTGVSGYAVVPIFTFYNYIPGSIAYTDNGSTSLGINLSGQPGSYGSNNVNATGTSPTLNMDALSSAVYYTAQTTSNTSDVPTLDGFGLTFSTNSSNGGGHLTNGNGAIKVTVGYYLQSLT